MAKNVTSADIFGGMFQNIPAYESREDNKKNEKNENEQDELSRVMVKRSCLHAFSSFYGHPYRVDQDEKMQELEESIREMGVLEPLLIRPDKNKPGEYEIIAGHRRNYAAGLAGLTEVPAYIRNLGDDEAAIIMVDSNNRREILLPSEKAWAYRTKAEALRHQGKRTDLLLSEDMENEEKAIGGMNAVGEKSGDSVRTVQRYIRLTYLIPDLLALVDDEKLTVGNGYQLSSFDSEIQGCVLNYYKEHHILPDKAQIAAMEDLRQQGTLDASAVARIMSKREKAEIPIKKNITLKGSCLRQYFPEGATMDYMEQVILQLLEKWSKRDGEDVG